MKNSQKNFIFGTLNMGFGIAFAYFFGHSTNADLVKFFVDGFFTVAFLVTGIHALVTSAIQHLMELEQSEIAPQQFLQD